MSKSLEASFGGKNTQYKKKNFYKQVDGDVVFRIAPPLTKFTDDPRGWSRYHSVHFGYKNLEGKLRTFESPLEKNNETKQITVRDPALDRINDLKVKLEKAELEGNAPLAAKLSTLVGRKGMYNVDNNHHMNVIDLQGNIGTFKIRHKAKLALDAEIKKLTDKSINPLSLDNGRFFVFSRTGIGNDTGFKVSVYTELVQVEGHGELEKPVVHKITPELLVRFENEGSDLDNVAVKLTAEEVAEIVATSDLLTGKSPACNKFFDDRWKSKKLAKAAGEEGDVDNSMPTSKPVGTAQASSVNLPKPLNTPPAATVAKSAALTAPVAATAPVKAAAQAEVIDSLSDDDFFAQLENKQA